MRRVILLLSLTLFTLTALVTFAVVIPRAQPCRPAFVYNAIDPSTYDWFSYLLDTDRRRAYKMPIIMGAVDPSPTGEVAFSNGNDYGVYLYLWKPYSTWQQIASAPPHSSFTDPIEWKDWSEDGRLAYVDFYNEQPDIFIYNPNGEIQNITNSQEAEGYPRWSKDGRLALTRFGEEFGDSHVLVMAANGDVYMPGQEYNFRSSLFPVWSEGGRLALFMAMRQPERDYLYILQPDGSTGILVDIRPYSTPYWSPVDERLLIEGQTPTDITRKFYIVEADGTLTPAVSDDMDIQFAWWTADGHLALAPNQDSNSPTYNYFLVGRDNSLTSVSVPRSYTINIPAPDGRAITYTQMPLSPSIWYVREVNGEEWKFGENIQSYPPPQWIGCPS